MQKTRANSIWLSLTFRWILLAFPVCALLMCIATFAPLLAARVGRLSKTRRVLLCSLTEKQFCTCSRKRAHFAGQFSAAFQFKAAPKLECAASELSTRPNFVCKDCVRETKQKSCQCQIKCESFAARKLDNSRLATKLARNFRPALRAAKTTKALLVSRVPRLTRREFA